MHPQARHGGTAKAAKFWVDNWYSKVDKPLGYNFFHTPSGPIMFYKVKEIYKIKNPKNGLWSNVSHGLEDFKRELAETIAICFKKE